MKLAIVSHKVCWKSTEFPGNYQTDGGFPLQIRAISELFDETKLVIPCKSTPKKENGLTLEGNNLQVQTLSVPKHRGFLRKINFPFWFLRNGATIWREIKQADAVHTPIPGDIGTIGLFFALLQRKPLFVRHCGNWLIQKTLAETFWKLIMERFAGGRNVMFATGGTENAPSQRNLSIKWIFSTSLKTSEIERATPRQLPADGKIRLITVCRLENRKGVEVVIKSLPLVFQKFPNALLEIVGGGSLFGELVKQAKELDLAGKVNFHGKVSQPRVIELMKQAHIFCFPTESEGFPKVVIEALACGLPVVTTKVSTLPLLIGQGGGILLDEASDEKLAEAIINLCSNPEKYIQISTKAIETARKYSLESWQDFIDENLRRDWKVSSLSSVKL